MKALLLIPIIVLTGCAAQLHTLNSNTPHTTIKGNLGNQAFELENPKDTDVEGLEITVSTNGTASIKIAKLTTIMNPTNIQATGNGMADVVREQGAATVNAINAAGNTAGAFVGAAAKTAK